MLGTRHRAALGISEQADVVALILSEETGEFAFAKSGKLSLNLTSDELREKIAQAITGPITVQPAELRLTGTSKDYALESREGTDR
jgi:diadenylate cyclase